MHRISIVLALITVGLGALAMADTETSSTPAEAGLVCQAEPMGWSDGANNCRNKCPDSGSACEQCRMRCVVQCESDCPMDKSNCENNCKTIVRRCQ